MNQHEKNIIYNQGREYERKKQQTILTQNFIRKACKLIIDSFPKERKPDDGNGDEFNAGYNEALKDLSKVVLDAFSNPKLMKN